MCNGSDDDDRDDDDRMSADEALLEGCRRGNRAALARVYELCAWPIIRFFQNKAKPQDIEDLCQETMRRLLENVGRIDPKRSILAFAYGIARNVLREYLRKQARTLNFDPQSMALVTVVPSAGSLAARAQQMMLLLQALREIPLEYQILFEQHYFEGISIKRLADKFLCISDSTARSRLKRARQLVKERLESYDSSPALITSTIDHFDDWVAEIRKHLDELEAEDENEPINDEAKPGSQSHDRC